MMSFLTAVVTSWYPPTNNQLKNSSNPRQQATRNNGRVTIQPIQGRQNYLTAGMLRQYTFGPSGTSRKQRVIVCYNYKGEGHMSKQCTKPKRKRDKAWFKDKSLDIENLKHTLSEHLKEKESLEQKDSGIVIGPISSDFYLRFSLLLNDMNIHNMKLEQFQVNTKFLNTLPPE
nr:hypothetical protein [Tanacetum cinerariifolium]